MNWVAVENASPSLLRYLQIICEEQMFAGLGHKYFPAFLISEELHMDITLRETGSKAYKVGEHLLVDTNVVTNRLNELLDYERKQNFKKRHLQMMRQWSADAEL